jgi:hypothetical protein
MELSRTLVVAKDGVASGYKHQTKRYTVTYTDV